MNTTPDPKTVHSGARYPDTAWGRIRAYLDNATTVLSRVDLGELLAENVQLKRRLEWPDEQPQDGHPLDPARKTCLACGHYFLAHRNDVGCTHCECKAGIAGGRKAEQPQDDPTTAERALAFAAAAYAEAKAATAEAAVLTPAGHAGPHCRDEYDPGCSACQAEQPQDDGDEDHRGDDAKDCPACSKARHQAQDDGDVRAVADVMWLTQDDEGNFGVWRDPDNAREQIISDRFAEIRGAYEWVNDPDRTHEVLLRDDEMTGVTLWMACVADAALEARDAKPTARDRVAELAEHAEEER